MKALVLSLTAFLFLTPALFAAKSGAVIREPGAIYLEDLMQKPVKLTTLVNAPIFYGSDMGRYLGALKKGQLVELQAVGDGVYRVRGMAAQGQVAGWVDAKHLTPLKKEFLANLQQNAARQAEVQALIEKNEVAINMTPEEVIASLGKPAKTTSRLDAAGKQDIWEFVRFERVPQQVTGYDKFGRIVSTTVMVKVPAGKLSIVFANNLVSALEQTEGNFARDARVRILAAPLVFAH